MESNKIIISPFSHPAKTYPYWKSLVELLTNEGYEVIQLGKTPEPKLTGNTLFDLSMMDIISKSKKCLTFISVDNFYPHLMNCHYPKIKGFVLFGTSSPSIYGYKQNVNIIKSVNNIKENQFERWGNQKPDNNSWLEPIFVMEIITKNLKK